MKIYPGKKFKSNVFPTKKRKQGENGKINKTEKNKGFVPGLFLILATISYSTHSITVTALVL